VGDVGVVPGSIMLGHGVIYVGCGGGLVGVSRPLNPIQKVWTLHQKTTTFISLWVAPLETIPRRTKPKSPQNGGIICAELFGNKKKGQGSPHVSTRGLKFSNPFFR